MISQDLDEILAVSDRVAVISGGRLSAPRPRSAVNAGELGLLMAGRHAEPAAAREHAA